MSVSESAAASRPGMVAPVHSDHIEPPQEPNNSLTGNVKFRDLVKIFVDDKQVAELSTEQVQRVREMHEKIKDGYYMNFNYNVLLLVASVLAGLGLVSNSNATILASMLVSPIMGPVIGLAYGTTIHDWSMVKRAMWVEFASLVICIVMGALIGLVTGPTSLSDDWPTPEMESRGDVVNLYIAFPVAFFSGLGVAVSILDDNTSSLVGVAISASLLPPAVNTGIIWVAYIFTQHSDVLAVSEEAIENRVNTNVYYDYDDYRQMGRTSIGITIANILLIWISSMIMFRLKEVLPIEKKVFWEDLGAARKIYQNKAVLQPLGASRNLAAAANDE